MPYIYQLVFVCAGEEKKTTTHGEHISRLNSTEFFKSVEKRTHTHSESIFLFEEIELMAQPQTACNES